MKSEIETIYADRCEQLARHVAAAMTLSQVSAIEAAEMALAGVSEWLSAKPEAAGESGRLMLAGIAIAMAAADYRMLRKSEDGLVAAVQAALAEIRRRPGKRPRRRAR